MSRHFTDDDESRATLAGERLPSYFSDGLHFCTAHAIRHNDAFARSEAVVQHCAECPDKRCARARNARLIMSNEVPDNMTVDDLKPYCFWYPDIASESTYRQLAMRYRDMKYLVGRACAVAGYVELYHELDLLPEVSVAEDANDNAYQAGSKAILEHILAQPTCYAVLDDYTRSILPTPRVGAFMNGDTAVRSTLTVSVTLEKYESFEFEGVYGFHFDIAEDGHIGEKSSHTTFAESESLPPEYTDLLYMPLPQHLPTVHKDPLIIMAAYEGNLDRYIRLRRPRMIYSEYEAIIRGVYHNTTFAKWWSLQDIPNDLSNIRMATIARFIMVNDLSHITKTFPKPNDMPGMIWWPLIPAERTLKVLAQRRPDMMVQVAMACIAADYRLLWDELAPEPCKQLWEHAQLGRTDPTETPIRNYYVDYLDRRAQQLEMRITRLPRTLPGVDETRAHDQCLDAARLDKEPTTTVVEKHLCLSDARHEDSVYSPRDEQLEVVAGWELYLASSEEVRGQIRASEWNWMDLYNEDYGILGSQLLDEPEELDIDAI